MRFLQNLRSFDICIFALLTFHKITPKFAMFVKRSKKSLWFRFFYHGHGQSIEHLYILCKDVWALEIALKKYLFISLGHLLFS